MSSGRVAWSTGTAWNKNKYTSWWRQRKEDRLSQRELLGNKQFDLDTSDFVIVDGVKYKGTSGLYELIFKRIPDDTIYTENDKLAYKHKRSFNKNARFLNTSCVWDIHSICFFLKNILWH